MSKKLVIWGAGNYGKLAFYYFNEVYDTIFYVDKNAKKWGRTLNGVTICNPDIFDFYDYDVVIASKYDLHQISMELKEKGVKSITIFSVHTEALITQNDINDSKNAVYDNKIIVHFSGGLGNQLFQYALMKNFELTSKADIYGNISSCKLSGSRDFCLDKVFKRLNFNLLSDEREQKYVEEISQNSNFSKFVFYRENMCRGTKKTADKSLINADAGVFIGTFQSCYWANSIRKELLEKLEFDYCKEKALSNLVEEICSDDRAVSIHFRRGDYLNERNIFSYGDICDSDYYRNAIKYITKKVGEVHFYVFSDDIEFVKQNYSIPNATYVENNLFADYEDWYDMCLMSACKHNIIANSTFSWWGAWLNENPEKIVVAPKRWINTYEYLDIYPKEWITI